MTDSQGSGARSRRSLIAAIAAVVLVLLAFAISNKPVTGDDLRNFQLHLNYFLMLFYRHWACLLILAGFLLSIRQTKRIVGLALGGAILIGMASEATYIARLMGWISLSTENVLAQFYLAGPSALICIVLLSMVRFRPHLDWVRKSSICIVALLGIYQAGVYYFLPSSIILRSVLTLLWLSNFLLLCVAAWCIAFRTGTRHAPPSDAGRIIKLTCPRCESPQDIRAGHGECENCRLQISIALEEGLCEGCGYPLRGLTGDRCPECGHIFVKNVPAAAVALPGNDVNPPQNSADFTPAS
jgi:hypothetical protein